MLRPAQRAALAALLVATGCTTRLYEGPVRSAGEVAVIHVGTAVVREIDGQKRRGGAFDVGQFEVQPGPHRLALVFALPARSVGMKTFPAQTGTGMCVLEFSTAAGKQYYLGSRARGEFHVPRWDGSWEGWVRDPSLSSEDDVIARCVSQEVEPAVAGATAAPAPTPPAPPAAAGEPRPSVPAAAPGIAAPASVAPPGPPAPASEATIRLGEWNLRSLGRGSEKDAARIAAATDANFDILVVTEVLQISGGHPGYDALRGALPATWDGMITAAPRPNTPADGAEHYAILYRRERVRPCAGWKTLRYAPDNDGSGHGAGPDHFLREPAFGCFEAGDASAPGFDFLLAAYRAPWADGDAADVAAEVARLGDVFAAMKLARPGEDDLIIAGDFNLESVELRRNVHAADRTQGQGSVLNLNGDRTARLPDHILVYDARATAELLGNAEAVDVRGAAPSAAEFYRTVSDHLPIMVRVRVGRDDD
jgi:Endonuclease/Exonuclease/phosphatase family